MLFKRFNTFRLERRFGCNILGNPKSSVHKRKSVPGLKRKQSKLTEYSKRLVEVQKVRYFYGLHRRRDIVRIFRDSGRLAGNVIDNMISILESRLLSFLYRAWNLRPQTARQIILHKKVKVNNKIVTISSFRLKPGDTVLINEDTYNHFKHIINCPSKNVPEYVEVNDKLGKILYLPNSISVKYPCTISYNSVSELLSR